MDIPKLTLLVEKIREDAVIPTKANPEDSGLDLTLLGKAKDISNNTALYHTGIRATIKEAGWDLKIYPRSSISKTGYMLANSIGVVDQTYRGELFVALCKIDPSAQDLTFPIKLAQLLPERVPIVQVQEAVLDQTSRGAGGFGSTGK